MGWDNDQMHKLRVDTGWGDAEFEAFKDEYNARSGHGTGTGQRNSFDDFKTWFISEGHYDTNLADDAYNEHYSDMPREEFDALVDQLDDPEVRDVGLAGLFDGSAGETPEDIARHIELAGTADSPGQLLALTEQDKASDTIGAVETPEFATYTPDEYQVGDPLELAQAEFDETGETAWSGDTAMRRSANYFEGIRDGDGMDAASLAAREANMREAEQRSKAMRDANQQAAEVRGISGSGAELLGDLASSGAMTEAAYMHALGADAMSQDRKDQAGTMAYNMGSGIANAEDVWAQWTTHRDDANAVYNNGIANQEAGANFSRNNQVSDANTTLNNDATIHNDFKVPQLEFQNNFGKAGAEAGLQVGMGNTIGAFDNSNRAFEWNEKVYEESKPDAWETITQGIGTVLGFGSDAATAIDYFLPTSGPKKKEGQP